jgi:hypothetical protein
MQQLALKCSAFCCGAAHVQAAKEVTTALSLNYPSSADMAATCGYERPLDRYETTA